MPFNQPPPDLGNQYDDDRVLRSWLARALPPEVLTAIVPQLSEMGALAGGDLYRAQLADRLDEPGLIHWDAWGNRIDRIEITPLWREAERLATKYGLVAIPYERAHGRFSRVHQFGLVYLFTPSTDLYSCPLAMTDGAARTLLASGNRQLIDRALPHLISRDAAQFWTSGQWMTESTGGSDVGLSETEARLDRKDTWRLYGRKWFTSATTSQMALTLARPEGNDPGGRGLALFYLETRDEAGRLNQIEIHRLKDKLGTRKVPTAELSLNGTPAEPVMGLADGVRNISTMLNITRTWNAVSSVAYMRRGLALARDYARKRYAFGDLLREKPLHLDTLAELQAEFEGAFHLAFFVAELMGRSEAEEISEPQVNLLRLITPVAKLTTARQCVAVLSEAIEAFGGAGYVEDTGLPMLLRDAHVFPIWEGTTNVLALDTLRAAHSTGGIQPLQREIGFLLQKVKDPGLVKISALAEKAVEHAGRWLREDARTGDAALEAGARRFALTLGRVLELALLAGHAQWSLDHERDARALAAAKRFALAGVDMIAAADSGDAYALANDEPHKDIK